MEWDDEFTHFWLRIPGPSGKLKGSERIAKYEYQGPASIEAAAQNHTPPLLVQYIKEGGRIGPWRPLETSPEELKPLRVAPQAAPAAPAPAPEPVELMLLRMEIQNLKSDSARAVDVGWLQTEVSNLRIENNRLMGEAVERQREAYRQGRADMKEEIDDQPLADGLGVKDLLPLVAAMAPPQGPPPQGPPPQGAIFQGAPPQENLYAPGGPASRAERASPLPAVPMGPDALRSDFLALAQGEISVEGFPAHIKAAHGLGAWFDLIDKKSEYLEALCTDPQLGEVLNGEGGIFWRALIEKISHV